MENIPFGEPIFTRSRAATNRPFLLIEPPYKVNGEDRVKASTRTSEEKDAKIEETLTGDSKVEDNIAATPTPTPTPTSSANTRDKSKSNAEAQAQNTVSDNSVQKTPKTPLPKKDSATDAASGKGSAVPVSKEVAQSVVPENSSLESGRGEAAFATSSQAKQEEEKYPASSSPARPSLVENIVLGVALEGSKRTLPIDEEMTPPPPMPAESQEFAAQRNGSGGPPATKDKKDG